MITIKNYGKKILNRNINILEFGAVLGMLSPIKL